MTDVQIDRARTEVELVMYRAMAADPLRHAPLVHDLVQDRLARPARGLDPMIAARHGGRLMADVVVLAGRLVPSGSDAVFIDATARTAVSYAIHHTHQMMMDMGHLHSPEERGALTTGRVLMASGMADATARAMTPAN